jgi:23S rRNA (adenine2030-N6)-methyltransferase
LNPDGPLKHYPGSPWLARQLLREGDRLRVFEMHSTDIRLLQNASRAPAVPSPSPRATASPV